MGEGSNYVIMAIVGIVASVVTWLSARIQHKGSRENRFIDQVQEQLGSMSTRLTSVEKREKKLINYVSALRSQIERGDGPPPLDWPDGIFDP